jgi:hypothetical protein
MGRAQEARRSHGNVLKFEQTQTEYFPPTGPDKRRNRTFEPVTRRP